MHQKKNLAITIIHYIHITDHSIMSSVTEYASLASCLILTLIIVCASYGKGASYVEWAYNIGDQPIYRLLFLILIVFATHYSFSVALMLALLFMVINSMVPMLTELDETFVFGKPLTDCSNYDKASVDTVGTPFYPIN